MGIILPNAAGYALSESLLSEHTIHKDEGTW